MSDLPVAEAPIPPVEPNYGYGDRLTQARLAGHGWEDVDRFLNDGTNAAQAEGYTDHDIRDYLGMAPPEVPKARMTADAANRVSSDPEFAAKLKPTGKPLAITPLEQMSAGRMADHGDLMMPTNILMPEDGGPLEPSGLDLNDEQMRTSYARSLLNNEVRSPRDFAERYAGALSGVAGAEPGAAVRAAGELAQNLPSDRDFTDQAIAIAHSSGVALTPYQPPSPEENLANNRKYMKEGAGDQFETKLAPEEETKFRQWVKDKNVPFDPDEGGPSDYDMRGFYRGLTNGDEHAHTGMNANDGQLHFSDWWKTPYHDSFSAESQWADPKTAPRWNDQDQLVTPGGQVVFDERNRPEDKVKVIRNNLIDHWTNTGQPLPDTYKQAFNDPEFAATLTTPKTPPKSMLEQFAEIPNAEILQYQGMSDWVVDRAKDWYAWRMQQPDATQEGWDKAVKEAHETLTTGKLSDEAMNTALGFAGGTIKEVGAKFGEAIGLLKPAARSMSDIMAAAPSAPSGTTRLYRVDVAPGEQPKPPAADNPQPAEVQDALRGRWWTDNPQSVQHYLDDPQRGNTVYYTDVPTGEANLYKLSENPNTVAAGYSGAPDREFVLPEGVVERYGGRAVLGSTDTGGIGAKIGEALGLLKPKEPMVRVLDPAAPNGIAGEIPFTKSLEPPKPAERPPVSRETSEGATRAEPPSRLDFVPEATPAEKMQAIARDWTEQHPDTLSELRTRNGGELPEETDPNFFEKLAAGQDPATVELAKGHDAATGLFGFIKQLGVDLVQDESGSLNILRTPEKEAKRAAYTDSRDFMRPLITQMRSRGEQEIAHLTHQADNWKTVSGQVENLFKLLEPHMPEWEGELAKGINGNPMNTMIGNLIEYVEGRSMGAAIRHDSPLAPVADGIRYINEHVRGMLEDGFKRGVINQNSYFEDYFRHMWKDPNKAALAFEEFQSRVGKLGSSGGLMQRTLPLFGDGLKMGLEPAIKNPLELTLFDAAQKIKYLQSAEILETARATRNPLTGDKYVNWRMSPQGDEVALGSHRTTKGIPNDPQGRDLTAYANPGLANTWNDWLSKGFHERPGVTSTLYDKMQYTMNTANGLALALPTYHFLAETVEASAGALGHAMSAAYGGHLLEATKELALATPGVSLARATYSGGKFIKDYLEKNPNRAMQALIDNGFRFGPRQEIYKMGSAQSYGSAIRRGQLISEITAGLKGVLGDANEPMAYRVSHAVPRYLSFATREFGRDMNFITGPLFDYMIPRLKAYNAMRKMDLFLRDNPTATGEQIKLRASQIARNTDERLGEMNMDNVYWPKAIKQSTQLAMISQGWVYGWVRQLAAAGQFNIERVAFEKNPVAIQSLANFFAAYGMVNSAYQYVKTGTFPWNTDTPISDMLMPRTGGTNQWKTPERTFVPSHAKELFDYFKIASAANHSWGEGAKEGANYVTGKFKNIIQFLNGVRTGKDAIGHDIEHTAGGWGGFFAKSFMPIFESSLDDRKIGTNISPEETVMGFKPVTKAAQDPAAFYKGLWNQDRKLYKQEIGRAKYENKIYINKREIPVDPERGKSAPGGGRTSPEQMRQYMQQQHSSSPSAPTSGSRTSPEQMRQYMQQKGR